MVRDTRLFCRLHQDRRFPGFRHRLRLQSVSRDALIYSNFQVTSAHLAAPCPLTSHSVNASSHRCLLSISCHAAYSSHSCRSTFIPAPSCSCTRRPHVAAQRYSILAVQRKALPHSLRSLELDISAPFWGSEFGSFRPACVSRQSHVGCPTKI